MPNRQSTLSGLPWVVALGGLAVPLIGGGGAGWPYVAGWLIVLVLIGVRRPIRLADRDDRIRWGAIATVLLVVPGFLVGGFYLLPAALVWLGIEVRSRTGSAATR